MRRVSHEDDGPDESDEPRPDEAATIVEGIGRQLSSETTHRWATAFLGWT